ncbi:UNVERIFIED_CONTAM: hypothetical protein O8I53_05295 [Campylobacter lari]
MDKDHLHIITIGCAGDEFTSKVTEKIKKVISDNNLDLEVTAK